MSHTFPQIVTDHEPLTGTAPAVRSPNHPPPTPSTIVVQTGGRGGGSTLGRIAALMTIGSILISYGGYMVSGARWAAVWGLRADGATVNIPGESKPPDAAKGPLDWAFGATAGQLKSAAGTIVAPVTAVATNVNNKIEEVEAAAKRAAEAAARNAREMKEKFEENRRQREAQERDILLAKAESLGYPVDRQWPLPRLRQAVAEADHERLKKVWAKQYNASCPVCRWPQHVSLRGVGLARCPRCQNLTPQSIMRALAPPMPKNFKGF